MANNLKKFTTEAEYSAATLNYPAVSWVTSGDTVHFDKSGATPTVNDKVMMSFTATDSGEDIVLFNGGVSGAETAITSCTLNDVDVMSLLNEGTLDNYSIGNTVYVSKIGLAVDDIGDYFSGDLGGGWASPGFPVEFLIPAQITEVSSMPTNVQKLVIEATTPPTTSMGTSGHESLQGIYVPDESLTAYQSTWDSFAGYLHPISEYQGNLPV